MEYGWCFYKKCETFPLIASNLLVSKHVLVRKFVMYTGPFLGLINLSKYSF